MGRCSQDPAPGEPIGLVRVKRAIMSSCGAYDEGGAYWGTGTPLYCAWSASGFRRYFRAPSRASALAIAAKLAKLETVTP
jgi:hypothetical protein